VCVELVNFNTQCNTSAQCLSTGLGCVQTFCCPKRFAGETCTINDQCYSTNCTNCVCVGIGANQPCSPSFENTCNKGLFCQFNGSYNIDNTAQGYCLPQLQPFQSCVGAIGFGTIFPFPVTSVVSACSASYICDTDLDACLLPGNITIPTGTNFMPTSSPVFCAFSNYAYGQVNGVYGCVNYCGTGPNDPACLTGYPCSCTNSTQGVCIPDPCVPQKAAIISCMQMYNCIDLWTGPQFQSLIWRSLSNGTCIYTHCQSKVWDYECCLTNYGTRGDLTTGVICSNPPSALPAPAVASALSSCFLLLFSVLFFIFIVHL